MIYLILTILFTVSLYVIFKAFAHYNVNTIQAIVVNYWVCVITGFVFMEQPSRITDVHIGLKWIPVAMILGSLFITTFNLMALTTQRLGVTIATVASKMSLVIPVVASLLIIKSSDKAFDWIGYTGMAAALLAIILTSVKEKVRQKNHDAPVIKISFISILLPLAVFAGSGLIDTLLNYANYKLLAPTDSDLFTVVLFGMAASIGAIIMLFRVIVKKEKFESKSLIAGVILGIPNYFSIYFLVMALTAFNNDGAFLYPVINIGVITVSALVAFLTFKEKLSIINKIGVGLAVLAIILLSYHEIVAQFGY